MMIWHKSEVVSSIVACSFASSALLYSFIPNFVKEIQKKGGGEANGGKFNKKISSD